MGNKWPESVLVVIHTLALEVLMLERTGDIGYWQSVTGSREGPDEPFLETARREVAEETGLECGDGMLIDWHTTRRYEIFPRWRHRYPEGTTHNTEHWFGFCIPVPCEIRISPREHQVYRWLPWNEAAKLCFSWSNREALLELPRRVGKPGG